MPISGRRDTKITIQSPSWAVNSLGEREPTYTDAATEWAEFRRTKGKEHEQAQQIAAQVQYKMIIDYNSNTNTTDSSCRVVRGQKQYDILSALPKPMGRPVIIEILAKKRNTDEVLSVQSFGLEFDDSGNSQYLAIGGL